MTQPDSGHETDSSLEDLLVFIRDSRGFDSPDTSDRP